MNRLPAFFLRGLLCLLTALLLGVASSDRRLGVLFWHDSPNDETALKGMQTALKQIGRDFELRVEHAGSDEDRAKAILKKFRTDSVDLIFAMGTQAALAAAQEVKDLPVVFTAVTNPVESGVVSSWEGSGRNLTGNSNWIGPEKTLHVFRLCVPELRRLGVLRSRTTGVVSAAELQEMREHLKNLREPKIEVVEEILAEVADLAPAVDRLVSAGVEAIWVPIDYLVYENMDKVFARVEGHGIPLVSSSLKGVRAGAVAGILVDYEMLGKKAMAIALDILERNQDPGKIPIGTMSGYQVVVNLGAARRCDFEVPLSLLALADVLLDDDPRSFKDRP